MAYALTFAARRLLVYVIGSLLMLCAIGAVANAATTFLA